MPAKGLTKKTRPEEPKSFGVAPESHPPGQPEPEGQARRRRREVDDENHELVMRERLFGAGSVPFYPGFMSRDTPD
jgi:hypothetical protein